MAELALNSNHSLTLSILRLFVYPLISASFEIPHSTTQKIKLPITKPLRQAFIIRISEICR